MDPEMIMKINRSGEDVAKDVIKGSGITLVG
jgi:hypothetical protein